jgi:hypothetical protein
LIPDISGEGADDSDGLLAGPNGMPQEFILIDSAEADDLADPRRH